MLLGIFCNPCFARLMSAMQTLLAWIEGTREHLLLQGLADTFILLGMPFDSDAATQLNKEIFECIYFAALETSNELAQVEGETATDHLVARDIKQALLAGLTTSQ